MLGGHSLPKLSLERLGSGFSPGYGRNWRRLEKGDRFRVGVLGSDAATTASLTNTPRESICGAFECLVRKGPLLTSYTV